MIEIKGYDSQSETANKIFDQIDTNKNGYISFTEFANACTNLKEIINDQNIQLAYRAIDQDNNGKISLSELKAFFQNAMPLNELCSLVLKRADKNKDGEITMEEFADLINVSVEEWDLMKSKASIMQKSFSSVEYNDADDKVQAIPGFPEVTAFPESCANLKRYYLMDDNDDDIQDDEIPDEEEKSICLPKEYKYLEHSKF